MIFLGDPGQKRAQISKMGSVNFWSFAVAWGGGGGGGLQGSATRTAPTGATIFLFYLR